MNSTIMYICIVVGTLFVIFSDYKAVCDVDPSDTASILLEQLKVQTEQLKLDKIIIEQQKEQLKLQNNQIDLLKDLNSRPQAEPAYVTILISVTCTAIGYVAMILLKKLTMYLFIRYNIRPEMPQTPASELMDFAPNIIEMEQLERLRSVHLKSPASVYLSGDSGSE